MENFRRSIGLRIREKNEVYEGEVNPLSQSCSLTVGFHLISLHPSAGHRIIARGDREYERGLWEGDKPRHHDPEDCEREQAAQA